MSNGGQGQSVPLKRVIYRQNTVTLLEGPLQSKTSLWDFSSLSSSYKAPSLRLSLPESLEEKCDRHGSDRKGVCCKTLKGKSERHLIDPEIVRNTIIGLSDGLTVPFALTAGLSSLGDSKIVVLGGVAELIAGTISMGVGGFLGSQSEKNHYRYRLKRTTDRVNRSCVGQMEREVHEVLGPVGVDEKVSIMVADNLMTSYGAENTHQGDVGLSAFFLKFGEGLEEIPTKRLYISALTIGISYLLGGLIPLLPYFFIHKAQVALLWSSVVTGIVLLVFGVVKTYVSGAKGGWLGYLWGAISTLAVGGAAAGAAYGIVLAISRAESH